MRLTFKELKDEIAKIVPKSIEYSVGLEAGNISIAVSYTHLTLPTLAIV